MHQSWNSVLIRFPSGSGMSPGTDYFALQQMALQLKLCLIHQGMYWDKKLHCFSFDVSLASTDEDVETVLTSLMLDLIIKQKEFGYTKCICPWL